MEISLESHNAAIQNLVDRVRALQAGFDVLVRTLDAQSALDHEIFRKETEVAVTQLREAVDGEAAAVLLEDLSYTLLNYPESECDSPVAPQPK